MERALVRQVFATLQRTLRETDVLGWYRQDRVAAAILTDLGDALVSEVPRIIHQRVMAALPAAPATHLRVSVYAVLRAPGAVGELVMRGVRC